MFELFTGMMKEEWRIHSTIFGSLSFALFPVMIFGIAFMGSFLVPLVETVMPSGNLRLVVHAIFVLLGIMVGGFGLVGMEAMNRRFGQASLIAYSARSLPVSEKVIFANFVVKDTVYYFILWVLPFVLGFALASPFIGIAPFVPVLLALTLTLAFLSGLSAIFFLSTIYTRSKILLALVLAGSLAVWAALTVLTGTNAAAFFPPLLLFTSFSWKIFFAACLLIAVPFGVSLLLFTSEYTSSAKRYPDRFTPLSGTLSILPYPPLAAKDLIDLWRSGGALGQTIFSFFIPLGLLYVLLSILAPVLPPGGFFILYAILTGVIASTMYTWITSFDNFSSYACLPVGVSTLLSSKICSFTVLQVIPAAFIVIMTIVSGNIRYMIPALVLCLAVSFYTLAVTIRLTGLSPAVLVYDAGVLARYLLAVGSVIIILILIGFMNPLYALASLLLVIPGWYLIWSGYRFWDAQDQQGF